MVVPLPSLPGGSIAPDGADRVSPLAQGADAVVIGPGFNDPDATVNLLVHLLPRLDVPLVLDATASAYLGHRSEGVRHLDGRAVLTVNPHELAQTAHRSTAAVEQDAAAVAGEVAALADVVVVCGGTAKHVVAPDGRHWVVEGGGPGLGVSGSGDVQAGILAGLLARGAEPAQAAVWAAYVHARIGERLAADIGPVGALARDQLGQVGRVLAEVGGTGPS
jgi:NAD(P)H-hydrate repair Nnr-like enzyme with NAD(P)H-hydrate dehydratase domain